MRFMDAGASTVRLQVTIDVRVDDPIAAAAYLLGPVESDGSVLALPVPQAVEEQVLQIVRDGISERLHADTVHTGVALEHLTARVIEIS